MSETTTTRAPAVGSADTTLPSGQSHGPVLSSQAAPVPASAATTWLTMTGRALRLTRRNVEALVMSIVLPVMLMLVFVYLFGGAIHTGSRYVTYVVPGVIVLCAAFGSAMTAVSVCQDLTGGIMDRFRAMDISGAAVVVGHVIASMARNAIAAIVVFVVAFMIGFRPTAGPAGWLGAIGVLLLFVLAFSWVFAVVGLLAGSPEAASGYTFVAMFLPYASSAFVPINTMPAWLHGFARYQPTTPIVETARALLRAQPVGPYAWQAVLWCTAILVVSGAMSAVIFRRRTA